MLHFFFLKVPEVPENVIEEMENSSLSLHVLLKNENVELISTLFKKKKLTEIVVLLCPITSVGTLCSCFHFCLVSHLFLYYLL